MTTQVLLPAYRDQPLFPIFNKRLTPKQRLEAARLERERLQLEIEALEEEDKASRLRLQIEARQSQLYGQLVEDVGTGVLDGSLDPSSEEDEGMKKEKTR